MENPCIDGLDDLPETVRGCVLSIGNFDGVHLGHQRILAAAGALAGGTGVKAVALTFDPPPDLVIRPDDVPQRIVPHPEKCQLLLGAGADIVVTVRTDKALLAMAPDQFIHQLVTRKFAPSCVVEGENFFFGLGRSGNVSTLREIGDKEGFAVKVLAPARVELSNGPARISSTLIRRLIADGRVEEAGQCLGRPFALYGQIVTGEARGRVLDFPTANISPGEQITPADGVYAGWATIGRRTRPAAVSIGVKPTFGAGHRTVEAFLIGAAQGDLASLYGKTMALSFLQILREQEKFDDAEALRAQIAKDVERVREICK